ncbi:hypothetical protein M3O96_11580 [Aquiflexum sp. TKW24L]|uniref:hypothetical protein n=1 Tax=Aquiflexum sp. TKW24L TaxID=2942212 RepID=UPI0020BF9A50|nr:hypothetical protein [Aquiflexum sp. TKW24L]MCL6259733.1 hypothetical protein [Aquiflexum sp. TKW24L]
MTKRCLFIIVMMGTSFSALSQKNNEIQVYYGLPEARMRWNVEVIGASSNQLNSALDFGIRYRRQINESWGFTTGLQYFQAEKIITLMPTGMPTLGPSQFKEPLKLLSIPLLAHFDFLKYFYLSAGPQLDFQLPDDMFKSQDQRGIGYIVGIGGRIEKENLSLFVFPNFSRHSWIPFKKQEFDSRQVLEVFSLQVGVGYKF